MRALFALILLIVTASFVTSCAEEYSAPTFPDVVMPEVVISGAGSGDTGSFLASDDVAVVQNFDLSVDAAESIFPACDSGNTLVTISDDTHFAFTYAAGSSTFSISPKQINETSTPITATITAEIDAEYGGGVSQLVITQAKANVPSFITQPQNVTFSSNVAQGSTATTSFVIDPASETGITKSDFSIIESPYYYVDIEEMSGTQWGYIVTFNATIEAVNAISAAGDAGLSISCMITLNYGESSVEMSDVFTITMPK